VPAGEGCGVMIPAAAAGAGESAWKTSREGDS